MKNKIFLIFSFITCFLFLNQRSEAQTSVQDGFAAWATVVNDPTIVSGNYKFRISQFQGNPKKYNDQYVLSDLTAGDIVFSNTCSRFVIVSRTLDTLVVSDPDPGNSVLPSAGEKIGFTREFNVNGYKFAAIPQSGDGAGGPILGVTNSLAACMNTHYSKNLSNARDISKYIGNGVPAFTPTSDEPKLAQGLASPYPFYAYNGSAWVLVGSGGGLTSNSVCFDTISATGLNILDRISYNGTNWVAVTDTLQPATFVVIENLGSTYKVASCGNITIGGLPTGVTYLYATQGSGQPSTTVKYAGYLYGIAVDGVLQVRINQPIMTNISGGGNSGWGLTGNSGTTAGTNFVGTTDAQALVFKANNTEGFRITTGGNLAIGTTTASRKLVVAGSDITINSVDIGLGGNNEASSIRVGANALGSITSGIRNIGIGLGSLGATTTGGFNTAVGWNTMAVNTAGSFNLAFGAGALTYTTGSNNSGIGFNALTSNTTGASNVALGHSALSQNTTGATNTGIGYLTLFKNVTGSNNTALGQGVGQNIKTGSNNTLIGYSSNFYYNPARDSSLNNTVVLGTYNRMVLFSDSTSRTGFGTNTPQSWMDIEGNLSVGANYSGTIAAPTNGAIIEGNVGIGTSTTSNKLTVDASSTGNPLKLIGLQAGSASDSLTSTSSGVLKRTTINDMLGTTTSSLRVPRLTTTQRDALNGAAGSVIGDIIYNSTTNAYQVGSSSSVWLDVNTTSTIKVSDDPVAIPSITGMATGFADQTVTGAVVGNTVIVNPRSNITTDNVILGGAYVVSANTVRILFFGTSVGTNGGVTRNFDIQINKN